MQIKDLRKCKCYTLIVVVVIRRAKFVMELTGNLYKLCLRRNIIMRIGDRAQNDEEEPTLTLYGSKTRGEEN